MRLCFFSENRINDLAFPHGIVQLYIQAIGHIPQTGFIFSSDIVTGTLFDGIQHRDALERTFEVDLLITHTYFGGPMKVECYFLDHLLCKIHHPVIILIGHIDLHHSELWIMGPVHPFVPEVLGEFIDTIITSHD